MTSADVTVVCIKGRGHGGDIQRSGGWSFKGECCKKCWVNCGTWICLHYPTAARLKQIYIYISFVISSTLSSKHATHAIKTELYANTTKQTFECALKCSQLYLLGRLKLSKLREPTLMQNLQAPHKRPCLKPRLLLPKKAPIDFSILENICA